MDLNLRGRTALITGGSKGIGLARAGCLAAEGVDVVLVSRTLADLEAAHAKISTRYNVNVVIHACELADPAATATTGRASSASIPAQSRQSVMSP